MLIFPLLISGCSAQIEVIPEEPQFVIISFQFAFVDLNGINTTPDLYSGGWFSYNITITNVGSSDLNATYTVSVYNPDDTPNGISRNFTLDLKPNQSGLLYPNNTFSAPDNIQINTSNNVNAYFADTAGAYKVNVTCDTQITFLYLSSDNSTYNYMPNYYQISFDAMPSYQEQLNQEQQEFYDNYAWYVQQFQQYSQQASADAANAQQLTYFAIGLSILAAVISYYAILKDEGLNKKSLMFFYHCELLCYSNDCHNFSLPCLFSYYCILYNRNISDLPSGKD